MEGPKWSYYQFRKGFDYPLFVRFQQDKLHVKFTHILAELGFTLLSDSESRKIPLQTNYTKILTISEAGPRLQQQIYGSNLLDSSGPESLSLQMGVPVYTYRRVGVMGLPHSKTLWDLAIYPEFSLTEQMIGLRIMLVRFLSHALAGQGVLCYWGTLKDEVIIVMKQLDSFGEAVLIDVNKEMIFSQGADIQIKSPLLLIRKDKENKYSRMSREELISFLSVNSCLLKFSGITHAMKKSIYDISKRMTGSYAVNSINQ